jgi:hypothetical protein
LLTAHIAKGPPHDLFWDQCINCSTRNLYTMTCISLEDIVDNYTVNEMLDFEFTKRYIRLALKKLFTFDYNVSFWLNIGFTGYS